MHRLISTCALIVGLVLIGGCALTETNTVWKNPSAGTIQFHRVVVVVLKSTPAERRAQEDQIVSQIKKAAAVASHTFIMDEELEDAEIAKQKIREGGFDGAVIIRMIDASKQTQYVPDQSSDWNNSWNNNRYYSPGYYVTNTIVTAEVSLYSVPDGKLLWAGDVNSTNPANARDFAKQLADATAQRLRKEGLLQ